MRPQMDELDVLRGLAVLMVLHAHIMFDYRTDAFTGPSIVTRLLEIAVKSASQFGWLGVQLFFVLSGFLITGILIDTRKRSDFYPRFYARRAVRILPAYFLMIAILVPLGAMGLGLDPWSPFEVLLCVFFAANMMPLFGIASPYGVFWSLAVEEQFYLGWPTIVRRYPLAVPLICVGIVILGLGIRFLWKSWDLPGQAVLTWCNMDGLAIGALLGSMLRNPRTGTTSFARLGPTLFLIGGVLLGLLASGGYLARSTMLGSVFAPLCWSVLFGGVLVLLMILRTSSWRRLLSGPLFAVIRWFGFISYGLYLVHMMIIHLTDHFLPGLFYQGTSAESVSAVDVILRYATIVGISVLVAWVSRVTFEAAFLSRKDKAESLFRRMMGHEPSRAKT